MSQNKNHPHRVNLALVKEEAEATGAIEVNRKTKNLRIVRVKKNKIVLKEAEHYEIMQGGTLTGRYVG